MTSAFTWGWVVSTTPRPLYPREKPGTHCIIIFNRGSNVNLHNLLLFGRNWIMLINILTTVSFSRNIPFRNASLCNVRVSTRYVQPGVRFCRTLNFLSMQCLMILQGCSSGHIKACKLHRNAPFTCVVEFRPKACFIVFMHLIQIGNYIVTPAFNSKSPNIWSTKSMQIFCPLCAVNSLVCSVRIRCVFCEVGSELCHKSNPITGPEGSRRLRLPDFKTIGTWRW